MKKQVVRKLLVLAFVTSLGAAGACGGKIEGEGTPPSTELVAEAGARAPDATAPDATAPDTSTADASRPPTPEAGPVDAGPVIACYDATKTFLLEGTAPSKSPSRCTDAAIQTALVECLRTTSTEAGCVAFIEANTACARCLFGAVVDDDPAQVPIGALVRVSAVPVVPNVEACAALVIGRPECAVPVSREVVCTTSTCLACANSPSTTACQQQASAATCKGVGDAACRAAIDASSAQWAPLCRATGFTDTYAKVARLMCGAP